MQPVLACYPNQSVLAKSYLDSDKLWVFSFEKIRRKGCFSCSSYISFPSSRFAPNFSPLKTDVKNKVSFYSTRCFNGVLGLDQTCEKVEVGYEEIPNAVQNGRIDVRALTLTLHDAKTADDMAELLKDYPYLPLQVYNCIIRRLGFAQRLDAAFAVVEWLKKNRTLNELIYNSLLSAVKISKRFYKGSEVIDDMRSQGFEPNIVTYNTLMSIYIEVGKTKEIFNLFSQIEASDLSPSLATYRVILSAYKEMEDAYGALELFIKLREKYQMGQMQLQRDSFEEDLERAFVKIENSMVRICLSVMRKWLLKEENNTAEVLRFLSCMDKADVKLDHYFLGRLVWVCTRKEHYMLVEELYERLREPGLEGDLSVSVCNRIIWFMGKAKKWWAALEVFEEMLERGPMPNNFSFELVVSNFIVLLMAAKQRGIYRWPLKLLDKMGERDLTPSNKQWNTMLIACSKVYETEAAVEIFKLMVQKGEKPSVLTYGLLLSSLEKGALYDEAVRVWDQMQKANVKPNVYAYTIMASMYARKGDHDMVDLVLQEMAAARIEPTVVTFNAIISGCAKGRMGAAAFEWFHKMEGRNVKPNEVSYEKVIVALARDGKPKLAHQMYEKACKEGFVLKQRAHDAVFKAGGVGGVSVHMDGLGSYPVEGRKSTQIKSNQSDFCYSSA